MSHVNPIMSITILNANGLIGGSMAQCIVHWTFKCKLYKCANWRTEIGKLKFKKNDLTTYYNISVQI